MRIILSLLVAFALSACAQATPTASTANLQQKVLAAEHAYEAPLAVAIAYNQRPRCTAPRTVMVCSDASVVAELRKANHAAQAAFASAMDIASIPGVSEGRVDAEIVAAVKAATTVSNIIAAYNIGG